MSRWLAALLLIFGFAPAQAQDQLAAGQPVSGLIDADHLMQMYRFESDQPGTQGLSLQNMGTLPLSLALIDAAGNQLDAVARIAQGEQGGFRQLLPPGVYYALVLPDATPNAGQGAFTLTLTTEAMAGVQFTLTWQAGARLSLEIRDPLGQTLHRQNPQTGDGGAFAGDTDPIDCASFAPHDQTQTASWTSGSPGSYELLVHYVDGCAPSVPFTLAVTLGGQRFPALSGTAQPNQTFVGGFVVNASGAGAINARSGMVGVNDRLSIPTADLLANAQSLPPDGAAQGRIGDGQVDFSYRFDGHFGDTVAASVQHTSGNLDTVLALLDSNGNLIAYDDDADATTTNSTISGARLPHSGTYLMVVSRYGQSIGATEGDFTLTVSGAAG